MIPTAAAIEAPTEEPMDDLVNASSSRDAASAQPSMRLGRLLLVCLVAEAAVVVVAVALLIAVGRPLDESPIDEGAGNVTAIAAASDDSQTFLRAWEQSTASKLAAEHDFEATGTLRRIILDREALYSSAWPDPDTAAGDRPGSVWSYRQRRSAGRLFTQIGDTATIVDPTGGRETCIQRTGGIVCSPADSDSTDENPAISVAGVEQMVRGGSATHRVIAIDHADVLASFPLLPPDVRCWEARSLSDGVGQRWGRRAQFCFHVPSGAAVFRRILGTTRLEVLVVDSVSEETNLGP